MINGEEYKRAFNNDTNRFLLESINNEYGRAYLNKALDTAQKHIDYYSTLGKVNLVGFQAMISELKNIYK